MNINTFISADVTNWFTQEVTMSYAHSLQTSPGGMGGVYNTRLISYYPEGDLPASVNTLANEDLPLFTPRNQILLSNPVNNNNDNPNDISANLDIIPIIIISSVIGLILISIFLFIIVRVRRIKKIKKY